MAVTKGMEKWKAKKWFNIYTPEMLGNQTIGEMPASEDKDAIGRLIKVSMSWITNNPNHVFLVVGLRVSSVNGNAVHTELKYLEQTYSYMHSMVKRHASTMYTVDKVKDKNGKTVILKLLLTTTRRVTTKKRKALRKELSDFATAYMKERDSSAVVKDVIDGTMQSEATKRIHNIASIGRLEVKKLEL